MDIWDLVIGPDQTEISQILNSKTWVVPKPRLHPLKAKINILTDLCNWIWSVLTCRWRDRKLSWLRLLYVYRFRTCNLLAQKSLRLLRRLRHLSQWHLRIGDVRALYLRMCAQKCLIWSLFRQTTIYFTDIVWGRIPTPYVCVRLRWCFSLCWGTLTKVPSKYPQR